jgi:hypothetical protein
MIYFFTNRRRAKDALTTLLETRGSDNLTVFVREETVYVHVTSETEIDSLPVIMHYAELETKKTIDDLMDLDSITELYKGTGIRRFRI